MFTGIIQCMGQIVAVQRNGREARFTVRPQGNFADLQDGESIAHDGVCLSLESHTAQEYVVYASAETLACSTLGTFAVGQLVNLERALALGDRLGGHLVSGHVDCVAHVRRILAAGASRCVEIAFPAEHAPEVIAKGSVALDGISLTINDCGDDFLRVNIIPDTQKRTTMQRWRAGTPVNMETDLLGKYVRRMLRCGEVPAASPVSPGTGRSAGSAGMSREFLARNGFL
ncbi:riboflavin synthase [uncultured Desulfovibrio sp.]|uniref:riboflavin synthase n=1 Tax=uncultured Desulfovibrio sp. TaxID=167968 RepID=UPI00262CF48E|nr:riboflavin synthase [uncultured Desulfovibrio sp.]